MSKRIHHADWRDWFRDHYKNTPWDKIKRAHKLQIIRLRLKPADTCHDCGRPNSAVVCESFYTQFMTAHKGPDVSGWTRALLSLYSISGQCLDDDADYIWLCPSCRMKRRYPPKPSGRPKGSKNKKHAAPQAKPLDWWEKYCADVEKVMYGPKPAAENTI